MMRPMATRHDPPSAELARRQYDDGLAAFRRGDNDECRRLSELAIGTAAAVGADREQALGHIGLSRAAFRDRAYDAGLEHANLADDIASRCEAEDVRITALHMRAELTRAQADYVAAVPLYEQLLAADDARGDQRSLAMENYNLGSVLVQTGDLASARDHLERSLRLDASGEHNMTAYVLLGFAGLVAREGDAVTAAKLLGAVQAHFEEVGEVLDPAEQLEFDSHVAAARADDESAYSAAYDEGAELSIDDAKALVG